MLVFVPNPGFTGIASFDYTISDGFGKVDSASVKVTIQGNFSGTSGNDTLTGTSFDDSIEGLGGNDVLDGKEGNDTIDGSKGSDLLVGGTGDDLYIVDNTKDIIVENASEGIDTIQSSVNYTLAANVENLILTGTANRNGTGNSLANVITGNSGNNLLKGLDGNDSLSGLAGEDTLEGGTGDDLFDGGEGVDRVRESANVDFTLSDTNLTGNGTDSLTDIETVSLTGGKSNNHLNASAFTLGSVTLNGGAGNDTLTGGLANDELTGGTGNDTLDGGDGIDRLVESGNVSFVLTDNSLNDLTGKGIDSLTSIETASLTGGNGNNNLNAAAFTLGSVTLDSGAGNDTVTGSSTNDELTGGTGNDTVTGGSGQDIFTFFSPNDDRTDSITDFSSLDDTLNIDDVGFGGGLVSGTIFDGQLILGTAAGDKSTRFIYDLTTGALFFDLDGTGASAKIQIATLTNKPVISFEDIVVI